MIKKIVIFIFFILQAFPLCAFASSHQEDDLGLWLLTNVKLPISEKFYTKFQISPRLLDNTTDINQFILHSLLGYKINDNISVSQGHAWNTTYIPRVRREQRIYQELILEKELSKFDIENRFRLDERFIQNSDSVVIRPRYRLQTTIPMTKDKKWNLVFFDELFVNLNSASGGPKQGIDQNRIYAGIKKILSENISLEAGYQLQHLNSTAPRIDKFNHFILLNLEMTLPQLISRKRIQ